MLLLDWIIKALIRLRRRVKRRHDHCHRKTLSFLPMLALTLGGLGFRLPFLVALVRPEDQVLNFRNLVVIRGGKAVENPPRDSG